MNMEFTKKQTHRNMVNFTQNRRNAGEISILKKWKFKSWSVFRIDYVGNLPLSNTARSGDGILFKRQFDNIYQNWKIWPGNSISVNLFYGYSHKSILRQVHKNIQYSIICKSKILKPTNLHVKLVK